MQLFSFLILGALSGLAGAILMNLFMRAISAKLSRRIDMVEALGSYFTGHLKGARSTGTAIHLVAGLVFGSAYTGLFSLAHATLLPASLLLGLGIGFFHGLITSYALMFFASERHPVEQYRNATLEIGVIHLLGHMLYGSCVGLICGLVAGGLQSGAG